MSGPGDRRPHPFESLPFWAELAARPPAAGPVDWEVAHRVAATVAGGGGPAVAGGAGGAEAWAALARVAELRLAPATPPLHAVVRVVPVAAEEWARRSLEVHRGLLEALARALRPPGDDGSDAARGEGPPPSAIEGLVFGWMFGQLARRSFGQHDLPLPRPAPGPVLVVPANVDAFAEAWQLPGDEVRLWVCLRALAHAAVLALPHVAHRLEVLLARHAIGFRVDPTALADEIDDLDPADPLSFRRVLGEPEEVVAAVSTPEQLAARAALDALVAVIEGWVDHVVAAAGRPLLARFDPLVEAVRRWRSEASWGDRFGARMLGVELRPSTYERGRAFVDGVVERDGEEALGLVWASEETLPTAAEVDAPGLWLARIELPGP